MSTRITALYNSMTTTSVLQASSSKLADLQFQLASGTKLNKPSDSPADTAAALQLRAEAARQTQYDTNSNDAQGWLSQTDSTLTAVNTQLQSARTALVRGLNSGSLTSSDQATIANQIDSLRAGVLKLANTTYMGRPIFGGTTTGTTAFNSSGAYVGDSGVVTRTVAQGTTEAVSSSGTAVFGADGSNLFDVMSSASADLRSNNTTALAGDLTKLDAAMQNISSQQASAGTTSARITDLQTTAASQTLTRTAQLSDLQDVDTASMAIQVSSANVAYQAALQTTASIRQTSLLDFLK